MSDLRLEVAPILAGDGVPFLSPEVWTPAPHPPLAESGYHVQEFRIAGTARRFDPEGRAAGTVPYATRALVIAPDSDTAFTGVVHLELLNPSAGEDWPMFWADAGFHLMERGDAYIGITCKSITVDELVAQRPTRYGGLSFPHDSAIWDMLGAVARACRLPEAGGMLVGLRAPRRVFATGWSQSGSFLRTYLGERFHDEHSELLQAEGLASQVVDGYLIGVSSGGFGPMGYVEPGRNGEIVFDENFVPVTDNPHQIAMDDSRRTILHAPVPVIEYMSEDEAVHHVRHRRPDSDEPGDLYRCYQVPGRGHETGLLRTAARAAELVASPLAAAEWSDPPRHESSRWLIAAVVSHLADWVEGVAPPRSDPIVVVVEPGSPDPRGLDHSGVRMPTDALGHARGGLRHLEVDAPAARWAIDETGPLTMRAWVRMPLAEAELRDLYGDRDAYAAAVQAAVERLVRSGSLLPQHALAAYEAAVAQVGG